jgi:hypothetical protein
MHFHLQTRNISRAEYQRSIFSPVFQETIWKEALLLTHPVFCFTPNLCDYRHLPHHFVSLSRARRHRQSPLEELALGVKNLAVDLRDGVRLARVAEMVGNTRGLMQVCVCDRVIVLLCHVCELLDVNASAHGCILLHTSLSPEPAFCRNSHIKLIAFNLFYSSPP